MFKNVFSALLADKKIYKAKFAEEIGVTRQTVYSWLDGNFAPDKKTEEKIAAYFCEKKYSLELKPSMGFAR